MSTTDLCSGRVRHEKWRFSQDTVEKADFCCHGGMIRGKAGSRDPVGMHQHRSPPCYAIQVLDHRSDKRPKCGSAPRPRCSDGTQVCQEIHHAFPTALLNSNTPSLADILVAFLSWFDMCNEISQAALLGRGLIPSSRTHIRCQEIRPCPKHYFVGR